MEAVLIQITATMMITKNQMITAIHRLNQISVKILKTGAAGYMKTVLLQLSPKIKTVSL